MPTIYEWQAPLVVKSSDELHGMILSKSLPSMNVPSIHGRMISMGAMQYVNKLWPLNKS